MQTNNRISLSSTQNKTELPLSQVQENAWFLYRLENNSCADKFSFAFSWHNKINNQFFAQALQQLLQRHLLLNSIYIEDVGKVTRSIKSQVQVKLENILEFVDAASWNEEEIQHQLSRFSHISFNLAEGIVLRVGVFNITPVNHIVLFTIHRIAGDHWSLLKLVDEFLILYKCQISGRDININIERISTTYQDYVEKENNLLESAAGVTLRKWWHSKLTGELPIIDLPSSRSRPPLRSYQGGSIQFTIPSELVFKIKKFTEIQQVDISTFFLSAFGLLIYRYTDTEDILIGLLSALRNEFKYDKLVGNLANITVIKNNISHHLNFVEYLQQVKTEVELAKPRCNYPFSQLVKELQPNSQLSYPPICQVGFEYYNLAKLEEISQILDQNNHEFEFFKFTQQSTEFDLSLSLLESQENFLASIHYNSTLFDEDCINRAVEHLQVLFESIIETPQKSISQLEILTKKEQNKLLINWNNTAKNYDLSRCLHQLFEYQVKRNPNSNAITFGEETLTYQELNNKANQLAHYLQTLGVKVEVLVGICIERSLEMVIGLLGILKAGGAYVPLDPEYPSQRLADILEDSQVSVLLTQEKLLKQLPKNQTHTQELSTTPEKDKDLKLHLSPEIVCLDSEWEEKISTQETSNPINDISPENLAYVIYTSGSTGKPKGAMNTHRGICNRLLWMQEAYHLDSTDRVLQKTPFSFDVSVWEFFWTLLNGAELIVAKPGGHRDNNYLRDLIIKSQITTLHFVPSMLQVFLDTGGLEKCKSLRRVICSGEALPLDLQTRFFQLLECELHNLYGPTEAAIDVTFWQCQRHNNNQLTSVPIGRPIANTQIYILDSQMQPVPTGVTGEIYIGGFGVGRGYLNLPELTTQRFIPDPFYKSKQIAPPDLLTPIPSPNMTLSRHAIAALPADPLTPVPNLYKTGDLGRYLADGNIEYIGRADYQVKIRGFRIELGEIENALSAHPQVREAVVITRSDKQGDKQLVAYITVDGEQPTPDIFREFLKQNLPDYMVPAAFVILEALPLTPSGKVNRRGLPKPTVTNFSQQNNFIPPRNDTEKGLTKIWSQILDIQPIGVFDNFFELGGTSLSAIYLMAEIRKQFAKDLPLAAVLTNPTIAELSNILHLSSDSFDNSPLVPIQTKGNKEPFFCVHPAGGHVLCYFNLARYLGDDQPFYGLQAQGFNSEEEPLTKVEDMASLYVQAIQKIKPNGPYQIGGWSFGGVVAFEVAQQLQKQGHEVSLLAILDSYMPVILDKQKKIDNPYLVGVLSRVFGGMFGKDNLVSPDEIKHLGVEEQIDYIIEKARELKIFPPGVERQQNRRILDVLVGTLKATYSYVRRPYPGKVTVFRAREKHIMAPDPTLVWVELFSVMAAQDIKIVDVPGNHYTFILEPHVKALADSLKPFLQ
ncbi:non-ribosomal peptide synthetase [Mastigocoleus testarum]|uniref:Non-ribosomal peptide synthetase n=1 Tax=Mastigocoleus testarum BC008 TaxID=371196 RepID=A0A0V7ZDT2_9CYAN|nr:non-ribosomal peptide synthetase [Mastigocoleus testarum]KST62690.1 non-ribosomal peptide synthetase [Mastigocoleus testarum BC008]